jgi:hypothetical protein
MSNDEYKKIIYNTIIEKEEICKFNLEVLKNNFFI